VPIPPAADLPQESLRPGGVVVPYGPADHELHGAQPPTTPTGRWCPFCGADLSGVPIDQSHEDDAMFAAAGRRLKVALAVAFVVIWLIVQIWDWIDDPAVALVPGWYSALGAVLLFWLLGFDAAGYFRRKGRV
jgi:hypothetical protein